MCDGAAARYSLLHKRATIDLSQPFRFTGIPNNATVDLSETSSSSGGGRGTGGAGAGEGGGGKVRIGLQVPGGRRLAESFEPSISLAGILAYWVSNNAQLDPYFLVADAPVSVVYLRQAFQGHEVLAQTTLLSMGLRGGSSALLTLRLIPHPAKASPYALGGGRRGGVAAATVAAAAAVRGGGGDGVRDVTEENKLGSLPDEPLPSLPVPEKMRERETSDGAAAAAAAAATATAGGRAVIGRGGDKEVNNSSSSDSMNIASADAVGPPPSSSSSSTSTDTTTTTTTSSLPAAEASLALLSSSHFDSDVKETVLLLTRYLDNIISRPSDPRTRKIKCTNPHYLSSIHPRQGALPFLLALGFTHQTHGGLAHEIAANPTAFTYLALPPDREDTSLLLRARRLLSSLATTLELDLAPPPNPNPTTPTLPSSLPTFDPYRPSFTSMSMQVPREARGPSITERKLAELKQRQAAIQATHPPRNIQVFLPPSLTNTPSSRREDAREEEGGASSLPLNSDMQAIARNLALKMAQKKREEDAPFRTKAQRELEALEKATVYPHTLLRLSLPDRRVIQFQAHPRETIGDVKSLIWREILGMEGREVVKEEGGLILYVAPPRRVLGEEVVLQEEGMVPAANLYMSWRGAQPGASSERMLKEGLGGGEGTMEGGGAGGGGRRGRRIRLGWHWWRRRRRRVEEEGGWEEERGGIGWVEEEEEEGEEGKEESGEGEEEGRNRVG